MEETGRLIAYTQSQDKRKPKTLTDTTSGQWYIPATEKNRPGHTGEVEPDYTNIDPDKFNAHMLLLTRNSM